MKTSERYGAAVFAAMVVAAGLLAGEVGSAAAVGEGAAPVGALRPARTVLADEPVQFVERDLSGPRVGVTMAASEDVYRGFRNNRVGRLVSQFGWHFEHQITPVSGGPQLLTEAIPLFGGVEYGKFIPTLNLALGVRMPSGLEFGAGPSFTLVNGSGASRAGLLLAAGKTLDYHGVSLPFDGALSIDPDGARLTLLVGYTIVRARR